MAFFYILSFYITYFFLVVFSCWFDVLFLQNSSNDFLWLYKKDVGYIVLL